MFNFFLLLEIGGEAAADVFPRGEGGGDGQDGELLVLDIEDQIVGVDAACYPMGGVDACGLILFRDLVVVEDGALCAILLMDSHADVHLDSVLRELHDAVGAFEPVGGTAALVEAEIVGRIGALRRSAGGLVEVEDGLIIFDCEALETGEAVVANPGVLTIGFV